MPMFEFCCPKCGLQFEELFSGEVGDTFPCPECQTPAKKIMSAAAFTFAFTPTGPVPQNTGVSRIDHNPDIVIGRDAENKLKLIQERQAYKRKVIKDNPGSTGHDLSRTPDGDYRVMKPNERRAVETGRAVHREAMNTIEGTRDNKPS